MNNFIGKPLDLLIEYCNNNKIKYRIFANSFSDVKDKKMEFYVTNILNHKEFVEIIVSKFKVGV